MIEWRENVMATGYREKSIIFERDEWRGAISRRELRRRFWHMSPGLLPFALWSFPHRDPISPTLYWIIGLLAAVVAGSIYVRFQQVRRTGESDSLAAVGGYAFSVLLALLAFPGQAEIGLAVLAILAFGDGGATLGGKLLRGRSLPWNEKKSYGGLLSFVVCALPLASVIYWGETHNLEAISPGVSYGTALLCTAPAVFACAVIESVRSSVNDNIRVGLMAVIMLATTHAMVIGF